MVNIAPSILSADFSRLEAHAAEAIEAGADWLHIDVMDGHFVPNITFGPLAVDALRPLAEQNGVLLDVHLMIDHPERYITAFANAGADIITVHVEACRHLHRTIQQIREAGARPGVTLNPATPLVSIEEVIPEVDLVLIMSVNPGFSGQAYIASSTDKIRRARRMLDESRSAAFLEVDGGIAPENARAVVDAGADVLVAGNAVFSGDVAANMRALRGALAVRV